MQEYKKIAGTLIFRDVTFDSFGNARIWIQISLYGIKLA